MRRVTQRLSAAHADLHLALRYIVSRYRELYLAAFARLQVNPLEPA